MRKRGELTFPTEGLVPFVLTLFFFLLNGSAFGGSFAVTDSFFL
jgi:hypothetical protein